MKPLSLNLSKMKKISSDGKTSTFMHPSGHKMTFSHAHLSPMHRKQMESLPLHKYAEGTPDAPVSDESSGPVMEQTTETAGPPPPTQDQTQSDSVPVSQSSATPATPLSVEPIADNTQPTTPGNGDTTGAYNQGLNAIQEQQAINQNTAAAQVPLVQQQIKQEAAINQLAQDNYNKYAAQSDALFNDYKNGHIDPKAYLENMSSGSKVATAISLLLGGAASGQLGTNPALDFLNKQIDRSINAQAMNLGKQKTLLEANNQVFGNKQQAINQTRIDLNNIMSHRIQLAALQNGSAQAKATADAAMAKYQLDNVGLLRQNSVFQSLQQAQSAAPQGQGHIVLDPSRFVPFLGAPPEQQQKIYDEIGAAQATASNGPQILKAFDNAAHNYSHVTDYNPLIQNADQKAFHALLGPTFKDVEGTVRQAAMNNMFENTTPQFGDDNNTIATKRQALIGYLSSKSHAPVAMGHNLDLSKFQSTNFNPQPVSPREGQTGTLPNGQRVIIRNGKPVPYNG